jgi:hypothetical protein
MIRTSMTDCQYASIRARHRSGVPAMLVASIIASLTACSVRSPRAYALALTGPLPRISN